MLAVARREAPRAQFKCGDAGDLPFDSAAFDKTLCQFALMYLPDRERALREMARVTRPGGLVCVAVWGGLEASPGYEILVAIAERATSERTAAVLRSPFALGDTDELSELFSTADLRDSSVHTQVGTARFASVEAFVRAEVEGSPLADTLGASGYNGLLKEARVGLAPFCTAHGLQFPISAHIAQAHVAA
jgi:SAM-dependent methyltransferase